MFTDCSGVALTGNAVRKLFDPDKAVIHAVINSDLASIEPARDNRSGKPHRRICVARQRGYRVTRYAPSITSITSTTPSADPISAERRPFSTFAPVGPAMSRMFPRTRDHSTNAIITGTKATTMPVPHSRGIHPSPVAMLTVAPRMSNATAAVVTLPWRLGPFPLGTQPHLTLLRALVSQLLQRGGEFLTEVPRQLGR